MSDPASLSPGALPTAQPDPGLAASLETLGGELAADLARKPQGDMATRVATATATPCSQEWCPAWTW